MAPKFGTVGQPVIVRARSGSYRDRTAVITQVARRWVTLDTERQLKFDKDTGKSNSNYHLSPYLVTIEEARDQQRHSTIISRLYRCGITVDHVKDHPDWDALEKIALIAEAGMPGYGKPEQFSVGFTDEYQLHEEAYGGGSLPVVRLSGQEIASYQAALEFYNEWQNRFGSKEWIAEHSAKENPS